MKRTNKGLGFGEVNTSSNEKQPRIDELVSVLKLDNEFQQIRLIGGVFPYAQHWIEIETPKGLFKIPKVVPNFDPYSDSYDETIENPYKDLPGVQTQKHYYVNCIVRDLQDNEPRKKSKPSKTEKKTGLIDDTSSKSWTPVRVLRIPSGVAKQLQKITTMNKHKIKGKTVQCELSDPKYGCDLFILFDKDAAGAQKYQVQKGEHSPLTPEEEKYLLWNLDFTETAMKPESEEKVQQEYKALLSKVVNREDEDEDEFEFKKNKKSKSKKASKKDKIKSKDKKAKKDKKEKNKKVKKRRI